MKSKNRETFKWNEITSTILKFKIPPGDTLHCIPLPSSSPPHDSKLSNRIQPIDTRDISTTLSSLSNKKTQKTPERGTLTNGIANISSRNPRWTKLPSRLERGPFSGEFSRRNRDTQNTQRHEKKDERKRKNREREGEIKQSEKKEKEKRVGEKRRFHYSGTIPRRNARVLARYSLISPLTNVRRAPFDVRVCITLLPSLNVLRTLNSDPETRRGWLCAWPSTTGPHAGYAIEPKNGRTRVSGTMETASKCANVNDSFAFSRNAVFRPRWRRWNGCAQLKVEDSSFPEFVYGSFSFFSFPSHPPFFFTSRRWKNILIKWKTRLNQIESFLEIEIFIFKYRMIVAIYQINPIKMYHILPKFV